MVPSALEDRMDDACSLTECSLRGLPCDELGRQDCRRQVASAVEVTVDEGTMGHNGPLPRHRNHGQPVTVLVLMRYRGDDDEFRAIKATSCVHDLVNRARHGVGQNAELGHIRHKDVGTLDSLFHESHGVFGNVNPHLVANHVSHDGVTDPHGIGIVLPALLHGPQDGGTGESREVTRQYSVNMLEFAVGIEGVNHAVDLLSIDRDTGDAGAAIVVGQQGRGHPPCSDPHDAHHRNRDAVSDGSLDDMGLQ